MKHQPIYTSQSFFLILFSLLIASCGGGGGSSDSQESAYKGISTQAKITQSNAEGLGLDAYTGGSLGAFAGTFRQASSKSNVQKHDLQNVIKVLKRPVRMLALHPLSASSRSITNKTNTHVTPGLCGGTNQFDYDVNDATGEFNGIFKYTDFCDNGITLNGQVEVVGHYNTATGAVTEVDLSFNSLSQTAGGDSFSLNGNVAWIFTAGGANESMSMELVIIDVSDNKTYWFNNYLIITSYSAGYITQEISGRYYNHDYGYIDITTQTPLTIYTGDAWPSSGVLLLAGQSNSQAMLSFSSSSLEISADSDGDNVWEWSAIIQTNTHTPGSNKPPIANAGLDQQVVVGENVTLDGSNSNDPDGDLLTYYWSISSCPGSCPSLSSSSSAAPSFRTNIEGEYVVQLWVYDGQSSSNTDEVIITVQPLTPLNPSLLSREWKLGHYGTKIGETGLSIADIDNNGTLDIVTTASKSDFWSNSMWYVVGEDGNGGYRQIWSSDSHTSNITRLLVADANTDGISEIYVGFEDGTVRIYDGQSFDEIGSLKAGSNIAAMAVKDADGDGAVDIVTSDGIKLYLFSASDYSEQWQLTSFGGTDIAIGNVDDDSSPEIVTTSNSGHGYVIDGVSKSLQWDYVDGFGAQVILGNLDADIRDEIVGIKNGFNIFDAEIKTPSWGVTVNTAVPGVIVTDVDNDGINEIIYGQSDGEVHCLDIQTKQDKWVIPYGHLNYEGINSYIGFADLDNDSVKELVWGSGGHSTGADHLNIVDSDSFTIEWQSIHIDPPFSAVDLGDVDDDGQEEIVMVSFESNSGYDQGIIHIFNADTHALEWSGPVTHTDWMGVRSVRIGDVDDDGQTEFVITTGDIYDGIIQIYNGKDHTLERESAGYDGNFFTSIEIGDIDNDGKTEIVAGQGREHTGADGVHIIVFDGTTLAEEWKSISLSTSWGGISDIELADTDGDGNIEIIAAYGDNRVSVYDGVTHQLDWLGEVEARSVGTNDIDGDGVVELLVGKVDGSIDIYDGANFNLENSFFLPYRSSIEALKVVDLEQDGSSELLISNNNQLFVYGASSFDLLWRSDDLGSSLGWYNQIAVGNIDADSKTEVVIGSNVGLFQFD